MASKRNRLLVIPLLISAVLIWLLWPQTESKAGWMDSDWLYRTNLTIGNTGSADTNKKVKFDIDTATLITAGKMQSDCGDSRFTDINGKPLKYYIDSAGGACNSASTDYYVLIPVIYSGNTTIYHYYGNTSAENGTVASQFSESTFSPTSGPTAGTEEQSSGAAVIWSFDEGNGTTTYDKTQGGVNGTLTNGPLWKNENDCISGKCLFFDGSDDHVTVSAPTSIQSATRTISFWMKQSGTVSETKGIVSLGGTNYYVGVTSGGAIIESHRNGSATQKTGTTATGLITPNQWYHIAVVTQTNGTDVNVSYYLNGKYLESDSFTDGHDTSFNSSLRIARIASTSLNLFPGFVDEVRIYPYARSANQIETDYNARSSRDGAAAQIGAGAPGSGEKLSQGLAGYWKLDESATPSTDSSGNTGSGTWTGNATSITGKFGKGIDLDGAGDYVSITDSSTISPTSQITVAGWIYRDSAASADAILGKYVSGSNRRSYLLGMNTSVATFILSSAGTAGSTTTISGTTAIGTGAWYHVAGTYDGTTMKVFVNGVLEGSGAHSDGIYDSTDALRIGDGDQTFWYLDGKLDEVRLYDRALSSAEIRALYNWAPGPNAYYKLDEGSGTSTVADSSGNDNSGTLSGISTTDWQAGKFGKGLNFDMNDNYISAASPTSLDDIFDGGGTVSFWLYPRSDGESDQSYLINKSQWYLWAESDASGLDIYFQHSFSGNCCSNWSWINVLPTNTWAHISLSYDNSNTSNAPTLYINGVPYTASVGSAPSGTRDSDAASNLRIGGNAGANTSDAIMDEVRIYDYTRTSGQIIEDMNGGHPVGGSPVGSQVGYWKFNEGFGTTANDESINNNNLTLSSARWTKNGKLDMAWDGSGSGYRLSRADDSDFDFLSSDGFSISMWFKSDSSNNPSGNQFLIDKEAGTGYGIFGDSNGKLNFGIDSDGTWSPADSVQSTADLYDNTWHHVVASKTGTSKIELYIDGKLNSVDSSIAATGDLSNADSLTVGDQDTSNGNEFAGDIDELKIYRAALTQDQALIEYNQGQAAVFGAISTDSSGIPTNSSNRSYCIPGDTGTCSTPVVEWKFDENTGTSTAYDTSGNNLDLTLFTHQENYWGPGKIGSAVYFDNTTNWGGITNSNLDNIHTFTWEAWIKHEDAGVTDAFLAKQQQKHFRIDSSNRLKFDVDTNSTDAQSISTEQLASNTWYHVAATYDNAGTRTIKLYLNGKEVTYNTQTAGTGTITSESSGSFWVGTNQSGSEWYKGYIDETKVYNYVRTPAQIAWDYNRGQPVAYYRFDECQGTTAFDSAPNYDDTMTGSNGTISIGATGPNTSAGTCAGSAGEAWKDGANGKVGTSLDFDGTDDNVSLTNTQFAVGTGDFSYSVWIKLNNPSDSNTRVFSVGGDAYTYELWTQINQKVSAHAGDTASSRSLATSDQTLSTGVWYNITAVYDRDTDLRLYINGSLEKVDTGITSYSGTNYSSTVGEIGGYSAATTFNFDGQIDDFKFFRYALTPTQVKTLYNGNNAVQFIPITGSP